MIVLKSARELELMEAAGGMVALCLDKVTASVAPGVTTRELDRLAERTIKSLGGVPSFKGYRGFPASICTSINHQVVHGIPGPAVLKEGDILSVDLGVTWEGFHGDAAVTVPVGRVEPDTERLVETTREALMEGIAQAQPGNRLGAISHAIQRYSEEYGFSVVRDYAGHGIGREMHERPEVPNYGPADRGPRLRAGMTLALEPMLNAGSHQVYVGDDKWTVLTLDGELSAHFEHTIAVTEDGPKILTRLPEAGRDG